MLNYTERRHVVDWMRVGNIFLVLSFLVIIILAPLVIVAIVDYLQQTCAYLVNLDVVIMLIVCVIIAPMCSILGIFSAISGHDGLLTFFVLSSMYILVFGCIAYSYDDVYTNKTCLVLVSVRMTHAALGYGTLVGLFSVFLYHVSKYILRIVRIAIVRKEVNDSYE